MCTKPFLTPLCAALLALACAERGPTEVIRVSGTVEATTVRIVPLIGGRIVELTLAEGESLTLGTVVARLDCRELDLQKKQAEAQTRAATARLQLIRKGARSEDIALVIEAIKAAEIAKASADTNFSRGQKLMQTNTIAPQEFDALRTRAEGAASQLESARKQYARVTAGAQREEIEALLAQVDAAQAAVDLLAKKLDDCVMYAPISGTVLHRLVELQETAAPGVPLGIMADLTRVKVKGYLAEADLGAVSLGQPAELFTDSQPARPLPARVTVIANEAEFTPKNIQTREERVKTMYAIELTAENSRGILKDGMPVDIELRRR